MKLEKPVFVTFHGIDGSGKTTSVKTLTSILQKSGLPVVNYDEHEKQFSSPYRAIKKEVTRTRTKEEQLLFLLASAFFHSNKISELLHKGISVIKGRYVLDVAAHHAHLGCENVLTLINAIPFRAPTLQIIHTLDEEERLRRVIERPEVTKQDLEPKILGSRLLFFEQYLQQFASIIHPHPTKIEHIDTTHAQPEEISQLVLQKLKE